MAFVRSKKITASQASAPFFVAPKERTSTPALPAHRGRAAAERHQRIGEARAVHMDADARGMGDGGEFADLRLRVDRSIFGRLGERQRGGLDLLDEPARIKRERVAQGRGGDLAEGARQGDELGAAREKFRCAAFVVAHMRIGTAEDGAPGRCQRGDRKGIGGGSRRHQKARAIAFENLAQQGFGALRVDIGAIGGRAAVVGGSERRENFGACARGIVACKIHPVASSVAAGERAPVLGAFAGGLQGKGRNRGCPRILNRTPSSRRRLGPDLCTQVGPGLAKDSERQNSAQSPIVACAGDVNLACSRAAN